MTCGCYFSSLVWPEIHLQRYITDQQSLVRRLVDLENLSIYLDAECERGRLLSWERVDDVKTALNKTSWRCVYLHDSLLAVVPVFVAVFVAADSFFL